MDINQLPLEVLQKILSFLSFDEVKVTSLVCHRWNEASELFIVRNGKLRFYEQVVNDLEVVRKSIRNYHSIAIVRINKWERLKAVLECIQKFPNARTLYLSGVLQDYLDRFYHAYRGWMERLEFLQVSLDDRFEDFYVCGPEDYVLTFPNLKRLYWAECMYGHGQKKVTIVAPELEYVYINDSLDASAVLKIPHCERIKYISCTFYTKHFDDIFVGDFDSMETLILSIIHHNCDISCLSKMYQLRYLSLSFGSGRNYLKEVEAMPRSKFMKVLIIRSDNTEKETLNLRKVISNFENLETLDLYGINLQTSDQIQANQLMFLKLREVPCYADYEQMLTSDEPVSQNIISLKAPKLKTLSLTVNALNNLQLCGTQQLSELYVDLEVSIAKRSMEEVICPFLKEHKYVTNLTLIRERYGAIPVFDDVSYDCSVENIQHLEMHRLNVTINFFQSLTGWKSLKSLKLVACNINCSGLRNDVVRLAQLERMSIDCVQLSGTSRSDFPILLVNGTNPGIVGKWNASKLFFSTNKLSHKEYKFRPFVCPEIDPIFSS